MDWYVSLKKKKIDIEPFFFFIENVFTVLNTKYLQIYLMILLYNFAQIFRHNVDICFDCNESFERWDIDDFVINVCGLSGGHHALM